MYRALPPSAPLDGEHARRLHLAAIGGARPRGDWHPSAIARLQGFSSCSPAAFPHQWSPRTVTTSSIVGRSKPGCGLCPTLSFKDLHHPCWGGGRGEPGFYLPHGPATRFSLRHPGEEAILQLCGGGILQPCRGRRTAAAWPGCSIPSFVRATVVGCTGGSHNTSYAARAVLVFWDSLVLVLAARTRVRTCRCALGGRRSLVRCWWAGGRCRRC
jgi:hypothetical protein